LYLILSYIGAWQALQGKEVHAVFVCVGGGGMVAGVAAYIMALRPEVLVFGVEADDAAGMTESLVAGQVVTLPTVGLFADGAAVRTVGTETFRVSNATVDGMICVKTDEICAAIKMCFNDTRCVLEPAGALGIAGTGLELGLGLGLRLGLCSGAWNAGVVVVSVLLLTPRCLC
jgi:threonine dehydratase